jgi:hypothetical protein
MALFFLLAAVFPLRAPAQQYSEPFWIGKTVWIKTVKESFRQIEFHSQPSNDAISFVIPIKTAFVIDQASRGWFKVRFLTSFGSYRDGYLHMSMLRRFLYRAKLPNRLDYDRAIFFLQDPDTIMSDIVAFETGKSKKKDPKKKTIDPLGAQSWKNPPWKQKITPQ